MNTPHPKTLPTLDDAIITALEHQPTVRVPADFAARIAAALPAPLPHKPLSRRVSIARATAFIGALTLTVALFAVAPHVHADRPGLALGIEMLLLVQLAGLGYGLMRLHQTDL